MLFRSVQGQGEGPGTTEVIEVPAAVGEQSPADDIVEKGPDTSVSDEGPTTINVPAKTEPQADMMPAALRRLHKRLDSEVELYKLHIKHYHMKLRQFKLRTSELALPQCIYDKFEKVVGNCKHCNETKPSPARSRVSGLRAVNFGDMIFADHAEFTVEQESGTKEKYLALLIFDAASSELWADACTSASVDESLDLFRQWMDQNQCRPKALVADMAFSGPTFQKFYAFHNIKYIPTGSYTPWPNRAESAVRLFKRTFAVLAKDVAADPTIKFPTFRQLVQKVRWARNQAPTISGMTPIELATGRRPVPLLDVENANPQQLSMDPLDADKSDLQISKMAMKAHLEAKQQDDLFKDMATRIMASDGPFSPGEQAFFWFKDASKVKDRVRDRIKGKIGRAHV